MRDQALGSLVLIISSLNYGYALSPLVKTGQGTLRGKYEISRNGIQYETYLGIPFAHVPRRFDVSEPTGEWEGIKDAVEFGPFCAQVVLDGVPVTGKEDCLTINVFTPKADNKKRAVLAFVHGGGFNVGSATDFGGSFLVDEDVVLVTFSYRLGTLGFLNTGDGVVSGNMGLKDQVLALKWIQENIGHFGGSRDLVTIGGQSAGSSSVLHLMTSPLTQGLFHRVYAISGSSLANYAFRENTLEPATEMADYLNCSTRNTAERVECLRDAPLEDLMRAQRETHRWFGDFFRMRPTLEIRNAQNPNPLLDETPEDRMRRGNYEKVPVMLTLTPQEGIMIFAAAIIRNPELLKDLNEKWDRLAPIAIAYELNPNLKSRVDQVSKLIHQFYFNGNPITPDGELNLTNLYTDAYFAVPLKKTAHILGAKSPVYVGLFTHDRTDWSPASIFGITENVEGVTHCEDLSYVFSPTGLPGPMPFIEKLTQGKNIDFSKKFVKMLTSFMETGIPNFANGGNVNWNPVTKEEIDSNTLNWLNLDDNIFVHQNPFHERFRFWEKLNEAHGTPGKHEEF